MICAVESCGKHLLVAALLIAGQGLLAQSGSSADQVTAENFLTPTAAAGMSASDRQPVQHLQQLVVAHRSNKNGDMADALQIQLALAQYWSAHNESTNAQTCLRRAQSASRAMQASGGLQPPPPAVPASPAGAYDASQQAPPPGAYPSAAGVPAQPSAMLPPAGAAAGQAYPPPYTPAVPPQQPYMQAAAPPPAMYAAAPMAPAQPCGKGKKSRFFYKLAAALDTTAQNLNPTTAPSTDPCVLQYERRNGAVPQPMAGPQDGYPPVAPAGYPAASPPGYPAAAPAGYPAYPPQGSAYPPPPPPPAGYSSYAPTAVPPGAAPVATPPPAAVSAMPPASPSTNPAAAAPAAGQTFTVDRGYYAMAGQHMEKWTFNHDGTFLHEGVSAGAGTSVRGSARGTYRIEGNVIVLQIGKTTTAYATPGGSDSTMLGAGTNANTQTVRMSFQMLGADGSNGVVLNGTTFHIRHGW